MIHVMPTNDLREHTQDTTCECNPRVEAGGELLVIHNSFDGREAVEQANAILAQATDNSQPSTDQ